LIGNVVLAGASVASALGCGISIWLSAGVVVLRSIWWVAHPPDHPDLVHLRDAA